MQLELSLDQKLALKQILAWYLDKNKPQYLTLGGYAGTGKTTLLAILRKFLYKHNPKLKIAFLAYTGKAARVLETTFHYLKSVAKDDFIGTIHSFIYTPLMSEQEEIIGWTKKEKIKADLIIIDESSMLNFEIWQDLLTYNVPILAVGDHGQLPPIQGKFNLMEKPDLKLEQIHRQAADNPIIQLSIQARTMGKIAVGRYAAKVEKINRELDDVQDRIEDLFEQYNEEQMILCAYNYSRIRINKQIRANREKYGDKPQAGDLVICLRNNHQKHLFNGMIGKIYHLEDKSKEFYLVHITFPDTPQAYEGLIYKAQFNALHAQNFTTSRRKTLQGDLFDFAYALTVHKAQGSQARRVILFEERMKQMDDEMWARWLYTAVTRAEEELFIIG